MTTNASDKELAEIIHSARPSHPLRKWIFIVLAAALVVLGFLYYRFRADEGMGPEFKTQVLERGDISLVVTATGNLAPTNQVTIGSELSGTISEVYVDTNDFVKKGQPLAKLDISKLASQTEHARAALLAAKASISQAEATLTESSATLDRLQELHRLSDGKTPSKAEMDTAVATVSRAKANLDNSKASVAQAEADLSSIERDFSKTTIRSPVDGIVLNRTVEVGQTVAASFTAPVLFLIAEDLRKMKLVVTVAEADIGRLSKDQKATFAVDAWPSRTYSASVKRVAYGSVITNNVVTYDTELEVANDDLSLRPGMTATADISVATSEDVIKVPNAALRFDPAVLDALGMGDGSQKKRTFVQSLMPGGGRRWRHGPPSIKLPPKRQGSFIWILRDEKPVEIPVKTGITNGRFTEGSGDGLVEGMEVIISALPHGSGKS